MALRAEDRRDTEASAAIRDTEWSVPGRRRSPWWVEVLVILWLLVIYDRVNDDAPLRLQTALAHGRSLLHLENVLHINPELSLNAWAAAHRAVALPMADFYDAAHFIVTLGLVVLLWWRYPNLYRPLRNALVLINVVGFIVFWAYPLAPPRMLAGGGFVDLVAVTHAWGSWRNSAMASQANELAAMPSLHIAWACWSSLALWRVFRSRRWRWAVWSYPLVTALIVMATANHYLLDVVGGVATVVVACGGAALLGALANRPTTQALGAQLRVRVHELPRRLGRLLRLDPGRGEREAVGRGGQLGP